MPSFEIQAEIFKSLEVFDEPLEEAFLGGGANFLGCKFRGVKFSDL